MCITELHDLNSAVDRRRFLKLGAATVATGGLVSGLEAKTASAITDGAPLRRLSIDNVVDLTHVLSPTTPLLLPLLPKFSLVNLATHEESGLYANQIVVNEHSGTHFDAPIHFDPRGQTTAEIPARSLVAPAVVVDIREKARRDPDTLLTMDDVAAWEARHGRIPDGAAILLHSGWAGRIGDVQAMRNVGPDRKAHFPGYSVEVAQFLRGERRIVGIGTDTMSTDPGVSERYEVHRTLMAVNVWMLESVARLDEIPPAGAHIFVGAPNHAGGSGGPARLIAVW